MSFEMGFMVFYVLFGAFISLSFYTAMTREKKEFNPLVYIVSGLIWPVVLILFAINLRHTIEENKEEEEKNGKLNSSEP